MKCIFISLFVFSAFFSQADLLEASKGMVIEKNPAKEKEERQQKPIFIQSGFLLINGYIENANQVRRFDLESSFQFQRHWTASVSQALFHHYWTNYSGDYGFRVADTVLSLSKSFSDLPFKSRLKTGLSSSLPLSDRSRRHGVYTVSSLYLLWSMNLASLLLVKKKSKIKNIVFSVQPLGRYYLSEPSTPIEREGVKQSIGGNPLPQFLLGIRQIGLSLGFGGLFEDWIENPYFTGDLSLSGAMGGWMVFKHELYARDENSPYDTEYPEVHYLLSLAGSLAITKKWSVSLMYYHLDRAFKNRRLEMSLFDDRRSTWILSTSYSFNLASPFSPSKTTNNLSSMN